jgi:hypothetical protein
MADPLWLVSGHDLQSHAFPRVGEGREVAEALCSHSVPSDRLQNPEGLHASRCVACLLIHGGDLAEQRGDPGRWVS